LELLRIAADLASNEPAAVAQMYRAAQRMNLNTVGKQADREVFLGLVRDLEGAGCVEVRETDLATSYGVFSVTEEGHRQLATPKPLPEAPETAEEERQKAKQQRRRPASGGPQEGEERTQSTRGEDLRRALEDLAEERQRREAAERERDELRRELEQLPRPARPWWVLGLLLIVVVVTLVALSLGAILSPP
jgi:hypothetical protein